MLLPEVFPSYLVLKHMKATELLNLFAVSGKRAHLIGNTDHGVIAGLDLEGRLYTVYDNQVINRVNPQAISGQSCLDTYHNPGGDGLWPAPEGTSLGYSYATGNWRVPAGIRHARFRVTDSRADGAVIQSEIDLINSRGQGFPLLFERDIQVITGAKELEVVVVESIRYLGSKRLDRNTCLLVPWSLCQFDCRPGCEVVFPARKEEVWDLYEDAAPDTRYWEDGLCHAVTDGTRRYQIGLGTEVPWIEYRDPGGKLRVIRQAEALFPGMEYIDIRDAAPDKLPAQKGVRYSIYSDPGGFMEIEAAGGCSEVIEPEMKLSQRISTRYLFG